MDRRKLYRIIASSVLLVGAANVEYYCGLTTLQLLFFYLVPYLIVGHDVLREAAEGLVHGEAMNEDFLMCVATLGALAIGFFPGGHTEFAEAVFVMLFFQVGELFEDYAEDKSRGSITHLMDMRPDTANLIVDGIPTLIKPDDIDVGDTILVRPGEKVPLDGIILDGISSLNTIALTGESMPHDVKKGDNIVSGCINISSPLTITVTKTLGESTATKILSLIENASENKSKSETFISRFAKVYTPIVVYIAIALAFFPPIVYGCIGEGFLPCFLSSLPIWFGRSLIFLVVSCPCALVLSVPLTFFAGIGGASRKGILIKGANYMDILSKTSVVVFDKTGTLTKGQFEVVAIHPDHYNEDQLLHLAAHVERHSNHPIAISLKNAFPHEDDGCKVENVEEIIGQGIRAEVNGKVVCVGNSAMMESIHADWHQCHHLGTIVHIAVDGVYIGHIVISDNIKDDSKEAVTKLKHMGVSRTIMLTGDHKKVAAFVAETLDLDEYYASLLPTDKMDKLEVFISEKPHGTTLAFVGDGINDAPVLARADAGIAMGAIGSDAAIEAADIVLMDDKPSKVAEAINISRYTIGIATQNITFAILIKVLILLLATFGIATMWMAVFADVGVCVIAVLNAMRALRV